jgi:hypothetical protein
VLVVRVELWPGGDPTRIKEIACVTIVNDGSGDELKGNYDCASIRCGQSHMDPTTKPVRTARVEQYLRTRPVLNLVVRALKNLGYK